MTKRQKPKAAACNVTWFRVATAEQRDAFDADELSRVIVDYLREKSGATEGSTGADVDEVETDHATTPAGDVREAAEEDIREIQVLLNNTPYVRRVSLFGGCGLAVEARVPYAGNNVVPDLIVQYDTSDARWSELHQNLSVRPTTLQPAGTAGWSYSAPADYRTPDLVQRWWDLVRTAVVGTLWKQGICDLLGAPVLKQR